MKLAKIALAGAVSGVILSASMKIIRKTTGNQAEILLYNMDYMPILKKYKHIPAVGYGFHYVTCISSAIGLYYILKPFELEKTTLPYVFVYSLGSGALYFLSTLTDEPPKSNDIRAWNYWTGSHAIFGISVAYTIKKLT